MPARAHPGRIAVQDGAELGPTFGWPRERLVFAMAGGEAALLNSVEGAEDDAADGAAQMAQASVGTDDVVIGVAASGATPFTLAALNEARGARRADHRPCQQSRRAASRRGGISSAARHGQRSPRWLNADDGRDGAEGGAQSDFHRRHDPAGAGLQGADGGYAAVKRQAAKAGGEDGGGASRMQ